MPTLTQVTGSHHLTREWRAAVVILTTAFAKDKAVWRCVSPGVSIDVTPLLLDLRRPLPDRLLLAAAQGFLDGETMLPWRKLAELDDRRLRLVLDALAISRGSLPID